MIKWITILALTLGTLGLTACPDKDKNKNNNQYGYPGVPCNTPNCVGGYGYGLNFQGQLSIAEGGLYRDLLEAAWYGSCADIIHSCSQWLDIPPQVSVNFNGDTFATGVLSNIVITPWSNGKTSPLSFGYPPFIGAPMAPLAANFVPQEGLMVAYAQGSYNIGRMVVAIDAEPGEMATAQYLNIEISVGNRVMLRGSIQRF